MAKILDCTFRDGGYYNNWNYSIALLYDYMNAMVRSGVDAVEIGFRSPPGNNKGQFANVTDEFIDGLQIYNDVNLGVMVNGKEMNPEVMKQLFIHRHQSWINFVRVAVHFKDIKTCEPIVKELKNLGYYVCCNLMQAATKSLDEVKEASATIQSWDAVDVLYLADSLGGMDYHSLNFIYKAIRSEWDGSTGFHGHNNKGQALSNSLEAMDIGVDWIDSTMLGMGRGAGNTETEYLLTEMNKKGEKQYELGEIYNLTLQFNKLKEQYRWGASLFYYLAAEYNIHPIFVQNMLGEKTEQEILNAISYLKDKPTNSFNKELYNECFDHNPSKMEEQPVSG